MVSERPAGLSPSRSSSGSAPAARGLDVIDLDRFMRGVRPDRGRLVVDGGEARRTVLSTGSSGGERRAPAARCAPLAAHGKRFSHDSGLSDDSYSRQKRTRHSSKRVVSHRREHPADEGRGSGRSLRAFRASCERELRDQRRQLARVAALCDRLAERRPAPKAPVSDLSSSSRTTSDATRRDEHRAEECKTYKIIMTKLDELSRVLAARRAPAPASPRAPPAALATSDKIVATDYSRNTTAVQKTRRSSETHPPQLVERAVGHETRPNVRAERTSICDERSTRLSTLRAATPACAVYNMPKDVSPRHNICVQSAVTYESSEEPASARDFALDDPLHLYAQAKRLHPPVDKAARPTRRAAPAGAGGSLCALCRAYWRSLRLYMAAQLCKNNHHTTGLD